jgi:hypothetical protein
VGPKNYEDTDYYIFKLTKYRNRACVLRPTQLFN